MLNSSHSLGHAPGHQGFGKLKAAAKRRSVVDSLLTIINYHTHGQTGKTIIDCHNEFEHAQNEWWSMTVAGQMEARASTIIDYYGPFDLGF